MKVNEDSLIIYHHNCIIKVVLKQTGQKELCMQTSQLLASTGTLHL